MSQKLMKMITSGAANVSGLLRCNANRSIFLHEKKMCSTNNSEAQQPSEEPSSELALKKILSSSSPSKPSPEVRRIWASNPYPSGTVYRDPKYEEKLKPDPEHTSIIMFPGQGNQFVGMANNLIKYSTVKDMFAAASEILGYDLLKLCETGPEDKLNKTEYCQPALLVCSLAALEKLKDEKPWAINNCIGTCGFSLGELAALVFAGSLTFEKAINFVKLRAQAMQTCCQMAPGGMLTVLYGPGSELGKALVDANEHCKQLGIKHSHCSIASHLFPGCKVVAGHVEALNYLIIHGQKYRLRKLSHLPVSGAFHTNLMKEASEKVKEGIKNLDIKKPLIKVYSNVNGKPYRDENDIKAKLPKQIYLPVKWEQTMQAIYERPQGHKFPFTYECGPGNSLSVVLKKINMKASDYCYPVQV